LMAPFGNLYPRKDARAIAQRAQMLLLRPFPNQPYNEPRTLRPASASAPPMLLRGTTQNPGNVNLPISRLSGVAKSHVRASHAIKGRERRFDAGTAEGETFSAKANGK